jgi:cytochrome c oxidase cbb3-type subunit III
MTARAWLVGLLVLAGCQGKPEHGAADGVPSAGGEDRIFAGGVLPAANALAAPRPDKPNPEVGAKLFDAMNCSGCHSGGGGTGFVGPSLVDGRWRYGGSDQEIFTSIFYGRPKGMPAFGGVMGTDAVWTVVAYLKAQAVPPVVPTTSWLPGGSASAEPSAAAPDTQP